MRGRTGWGRGGGEGVELVGVQLTGYTWLLCVVLYLSYERLFFPFPPLSFIFCILALVIILIMGFPDTYGSIAVVLRTYPGKDKGRTGVILSFIFYIEAFQAPK